jgi:esterase/lipase superfamily enzyme
MLASTVPYWGDLPTIAAGRVPPDATERYARQINAQLARSVRKDVYIFVHGYRVAYENPVLVSAELWHFLGYEGAFIAYSWPSTPNKYAYLRDSDTSSGYARNFRLLLEFLAAHTDARRIHVIGYSNGSRLVTRALEQLALIHQGQSREAIQAKLRIDNVILVGADVDREVFGAYMADGLLHVPRHTTVYVSKTDGALGISLFLARRERLGQMFSRESLSTSAKKVLIEYADQISAINVTAAEGAATGNGHGYFRKSPWASSDILMMLAYGLSPLERGLVQSADMPVYEFPPDYVNRLWRTLADTDPEFGKAYRAIIKSEQPSEQTARSGQPGVR